MSLSLSISQHRPAALEADVLFWALLKGSTVPGAELPV